MHPLHISIPATRLLVIKIHYTLDFVCRKEIVERALQKSGVLIFLEARPKRMICRCLAVTFRNLRSLMR